MLKKRILSSVLALGIMGWLISCGNQPDEESVNPSAAQTSDGETFGQILGGSTRSPVKIEVFSDFQCGSCREFFLNTILPVLRDYSSKDKVCVVYYEYPLNGHPYARQAARYIIAASRLGNKKMPALFEAIFTDQAQWARDGNLEASVSKVLSAEDFQRVRQAVQDAGVETLLEKEIRVGTLKNISSTPTIFISYSGKQDTTDGAVSYPVMKQLLDSILK